MGEAIRRILALIFEKDNGIFHLRRNCAVEPANIKIGLSATILGRNLLLTVLRVRDHPSDAQVTFIYIYRSILRCRCRLGSILELHSPVERRLQ